MDHKTGDSVFSIHYHNEVPTIELQAIALNADTENISPLASIQSKIESRSPCISLFGLNQSPELILPVEIESRLLDSQFIPPGPNQAQTRSGCQATRQNMRGWGYPVHKISRLENIPVQKSPRTPPWEIDIGGQRLFSAFEVVRGIFLFFKTPSQQGSNAVVTNGSS